MSVCVCVCVCVGVESENSTYRAVVKENEYKKACSKKSIKEVDEGSKINKVKKMV